MKNLLFLPLLIVFFSCSTPKNITYFQDIDEYMSQLNELESIQLESGQGEFRIKPGDNLIITVASPLRNQEMVAQFNSPTYSFLTPGDVRISQSSSLLSTYPVDNEGNINFPVLGKVNLAGKTKYEAIEYIGSKIAEHIEDPVVNVQLAFYGVAVTGEVLRPTYAEAKNQRLTILDALSQAGDMTIYGNRTNVLVIRRTNGKIEYGRLDLTKAESLTSPYYYLQPGDAVVVEPNDSRKRSARYGAAESYTLNIVSLAFSAVTLFATILTLSK